jgi:hypothetical protein
VAVLPAIAGTVITVAETQERGLYSSAPASGVVAERVWPSMSVVIEASGVPMLFAKAFCTCRSVLL